MTSKKKPNQFARVIAVFALLGAFVLVIATVVTTSGSDDSGDGDGGSTTTAKGQTKKGERALERGVWIVGEGDTLVSISEETGIDLEELVSLNPDIDPQTLSEGQRISLRQALLQEDADSSDTSTAGTTTNGQDPAAEFGDGSVADGQSDTSTNP